MNYDNKIKYVTSDLFLIECDWLLLNNLFKIKSADWAMSVGTGICNISKHFAWISFFCAVPEQPVVVASTEYFKKILGLASIWFSNLIIICLRKGWPCPWQVSRAQHPMPVPSALFCLKCFHMNKLSRGKTFPVIFSHSPCNFLSFSQRPAK